MTEVVTGEAIGDAKSIVVKGHFLPDRAMLAFSRAPQYVVESVPVVARFASLGGPELFRDDHPQAHQLAVKFQPPKADDVDLVASTLATFPVRNPADLRAYTEVIAPVPVDDVRLSRWEKFKLLYALKLPPPSAPDGVAVTRSPERLRAWLNDHPETRTTVALETGLITPVGWGRATYHGVNTVTLTDPHGCGRPARFTWSPVFGSRSVGFGERPDRFLVADMRRRLDKKQKLRFVLAFTLGEDGDRFDDPTQMWKSPRIRVVAGELIIEEVVSGEYSFGSPLPWGDRA